MVEFDLVPMGGFHHNPPAARPFGFATIMQGKLPIPRARESVGASAQGEQVAAKSPPLSRDSQDAHRLLLERTAELAHANEELARLKAQLKEMDKVKTRFFASVSHELRTPLNAILGFTGTMLMRLPGPLTEKQEKQLQIVENSGKHLLALINDLLDLARIDAGKIKPDIETVSVSSSLADVKSSLEQAAAKKALKLVFHSPKEGLTLRSDRRALHQILLNLGSNAVKFTKQGSVTFDVNQRQDGARALLEFSVTDTGPGISANDQAKLFEAFRRLSNGEDGQVEGVGLGLHLSRKLAEMLGGEITLQSEPGKGSRFTLTLPKE